MGRNQTNHNRVVTHYKDGEVLWFDSLQKFGDEFESLNQEMTRSEVFERGFYDTTPRRSFELLRSGDVSGVGDATQMLNQLTNDLPNPQQVWTRSVAGAFPLVPEFLSGQAEHMMCKTTIENRNVPIRIFYGSGNSGGISTSKLTLRGTATLALVMRLANERPVEFYVYDNNKFHRSFLGQTIAVKVNTSPLRLSEICYMLTNQTFTRCFIYGMAQLTGARVAWSDAFYTENPMDSPGIRELLQVSDRDIVIPMAYISNEMIYTEPIKWLNEKLAFCRSIQPEQD